MFGKKGVLKNFTKFTAPATLLKKRLWHRCFPVSFAKFLRTPFLTENLRWLLLHFASLTVTNNKRDLLSLKNKNLKNDNII